MCRSMTESSFAALVREHDVRGADQGVDRNRIALVEVHRDRRIDLALRRFPFGESHRTGV